MQIKKRCYASANLHFIGNSEWTTCQIRRSAIAQYAKSIRTIPLGLDVEAFSPVDKTIAKRALEIPSEKFVIGFACSNIHEQRKGVGTLIEALNGTLAENCTLLVFGSGSLSAIRGVNVIHLGKIESTQLQRLFYSAIDVFAAPSLAETFGFTVLESMACGTPVVAYSVGGHKDLIVDGVTGLLSPEVGNAGNLSQMLSWIKNHPADSKRMGAESRYHVLRNYTDSLMAARYKAAYLEIGGESSLIDCPK